MLCLHMTQPADGSEQQVAKKSRFRSKPSAVVPALQTAGAPLRTVTVRDTIGDLPPIENGEEREEMPYGGESAAARRVT